MKKNSRSIGAKMALFAAMIEANPDLPSELAAIAAKPIPQTPAQRQQAYKEAQRAAGMVRLEAYVTAEQREKFRAIGGDAWLRKKITTSLNLQRRSK